jgi:hypothetical protein
VPSEEIPPAISRLTKCVAAGSLFVATVSFSQWILAGAPIVRAEEHFRVGERLHDEGTLSMAGAPSVFRAPGFPIFVAAVLHARDALAPRLDGARAVVLAHGWLLGLAAVALFVHAARDWPLAPSLAAGSLVAVSPLSLAGAAVLDYATLHIACVTVATVALVRALRGPHAGWALGAGALWGAATLVRPISLILPPFVLLLAGWTFGRGRGPRALSFTALFTLGMIVVVAPYTIRNYRATGRVIAVNAQEGFALWGLSATRNPAGGEAEWEALWTSADQPLFARATGGAPYSLEAIHANSVAANDAFRREAARNIRQDPARFARNVLTNLYLFNVVPTSSIYMRLSGAANAVTAAVLLLGAVGLFRGLREGRVDARVAAAVYAMFAAAHAIAFLLPRYTYLRLPVAVIALPMAFRSRAAAAVAVALAAAAASFAEIPRGQPFARFAGGRPGTRPDSPVTRAQMAVFLLAAREGAGWAPPPCVTPRFPDVRCASRFAPWVNELAARGITDGCGGGYYCPDVPVTREQMAVFLLRAREGPAYSPPPCTAPVFADVPCSSPFARWINALAALGLTRAGADVAYRPYAAVTDGEMSALAAAAFRRD